MQARRLGAAIAGLAVLATTVWSGAAAESAFASGKTTDAAYVALGDSFSSGEGLAPYQAGTAVKSGTKANTCHRSASGSFASTVLPTVADRAFWACSGALISDMTVASKNKTQPAQTTAVGKDTKFITLTAGAKDAGLNAVTNACVVYTIKGKAHRLSTKACALQATAAQKKIPALKTSLVNLYTSLLANSYPDSQIVVAGYPTIFAGSYKGLKKVNGAAACVLARSGKNTISLTPAATRSINALITRINAAVQDAITTVGVKSPGRILYSDVSTTSVPNTCKGFSAAATVAGFALSPTGKGIAKAGWKRSVKTIAFRTSKSGQQVFAKALTASFTAFAAQRTQVASIDTSVGTAAPPAKLGPYTMTRFQGATTPSHGQTTTTMPSPLGPVQFSAPAVVQQIGNTSPADRWVTWSHGYTGLVFHYGFGTSGSDPESVTLSFPVGTRAVYFYVEPNAYGTTTFSATANNSSSGVSSQSTNGKAGATYFGFYAQPGSSILTVTVNATGDFAIGDFGISG